MFSPFDKIIKRGLLTVPQLLSIFLSMLIRAVTVGIALYALIMVNSDSVLETVTHPLIDKIGIFYADIPVGRLVMGVTYSSVGVLLPLQIIGAMVGYLSILCKNKIGMFMHFVMSMVSISLMVVFFVLIGGILYHLHGNISDQFATEIEKEHYYEGFHQKFACCVYEGWRGSTCKNYERCWYLWSASMETFCSVLIAMYGLNAVLELIYVAIAEYVYVSLRRKEAKQNKGEYPYWNKGLPFIPRDIVGDVIRYLHNYRKNESWKTIIIAFVRLLCGMTAVALIIYGSLNMVLYPSFCYPSFSYRKMMEAIRIFGIYYDQLIYALCISLIVICSITLTAVVLAYVASMKASVSLYCINAGVMFVSVLVKLGFIISWSVMAVTLHNNLEGRLSDFKTYNNYYSWWDDTERELGCCPDGCTATNMNCTTTVWRDFSDFTTSGMVLTVFIMIIEVIGVIHINFEIRRLTRSESGIYAYLTNKFKQRTRSLHGFKVSNFILMGILTLFSLGLVLFGVAVMHDYMFTDRQVIRIFQNISFNARSFSTTMRYLGVGLCVIGLIDISLNIAEVMSLCFRTILYKFIVSLLRVIFILCLLAMISVWIQIHVKVASNLQKELHIYLNEYLTFDFYVNPWSQNVLTNDWNILFYQYSCCGIENIGRFNSSSSWNGRTVPTYCNSTHYTEGCGTMIEDRFNRYNIGVYVVGSVYIILQVTHAVLSAIMLNKSRKMKSSQGNEESCCGCFTWFMDDDEDDEIELLPHSADLGRRTSTGTHKNNQVAPSQD